MGKMCQPGFNVVPGLPKVSRCMFQVLIRRNSAVPVFAVSDFKDFPDFIGQFSRFEGRAFQRNCDQASFNLRKSHCAAP
jgi:hypothetical protein